MRSVPWVFSLHHFLPLAVPPPLPFPDDRRWLRDNQQPARLRKRDLRHPGRLPHPHTLSLSLSCCLICCSIGCPIGCHTGCPIGWPAGWPAGWPIGCSIGYSTGCPIRCPIGCPIRLVLTNCAASHTLWPRATHSMFWRQGRSHKIQNFCKCSFMIWPNRCKWISMSGRIFFRHEVNTPGSAGKWCSGRDACVHASHKGHFVACSAQSSRRHFPHITVDLWHICLFRLLQLLAQGYSKQCIWFNLIVWHPVRVLDHLTSYMLQVWTRSLLWFDGQIPKARWRGKLFMKFMFFRLRLIIVFLPGRGLDSLQPLANRSPCPRLLIHTYLAHLARRRSVQPHRCLRFAWLVSSPTLFFEVAEWDQPRIQENGIPKPKPFVNDPDPSWALKANTLLSLYPRRPQHRSQQRFVGVWRAKARQDWCVTTDSRCLGCNLLSRTTTHCEICAQKAAL